ncbi:hypothetical protein N7524_011674 [Penicillium chrysogenum]|nr:hypothetical protein N7524_011674 [Penicillium chrysogenum]
MLKRPRLEHGSPSSLPDERLTPDEANPPSTLPQLPFQGEIPTTEPQEDLDALTERRNYPPSISPEGTAAAIPQDDELSTRCSTGLIELSSQGSSFLRYVFIGSPWAQSSDTTSLAAQRSDSQSVDSPAPERPTTTVGSVVPSFQRMPFGKDFRTDRCGPILLLAIACRGIPFTEVKDKEKKQQRLATMFRAKLMKAMTAKARIDTFRLDVLEGMALMIDFKYDSARTPADLSCDLFMTHDALVLTSLQSRKRGPRALDPSALFAHADKRFALLYWDIFALDAFQCLHDKSMSLISDDALALADGLLSQEAGSYLDAILSLSIITRRIVGNLCNATSKGAGIAYEDITVLHEQLSR